MSDREYVVLNIFPGIGGNRNRVQGIHEYLGNEGESAKEKWRQLKSVFDGWYIILCKQTRPTASLDELVEAMNSGWEIPTGWWEMPG